jgi:signal peptidase II
MNESPGRSKHSSGSDKSPMSRRVRLLIMSGLLATLVGCDQASKAYATQNLQHTSQQPITFCGNVFQIHYALNPGAFLSLFANLDPSVRFWLLTVLNGVILAGLGVFLFVRRDVDRLTFWALALVLAGGVGNLIDRAVLGGHVIDFMVVDFSATGIAWLRTGVFNVADMGITAGFLLLLPQLFRPEAKTPTAAEAG